MLQIRQETPNDYAAVYHIVKTAFSTAEHSDGNEHELVAALRASSQFVPELSLVAEDNGKIIGHIMFTEAKVGKSTQLALAPLSVLPEYQRQGVGTALIQAGHKRARELGYGYSIVLGSETYYPRMGYLPAAKYGISPPPGIPGENFMAYQLTGSAPKLSGVIEYAKEFGI